jgi:hypothetical protein
VGGREARLANFYEEVGVVGLQLQFAVARASVGSRECRDVSICGKPKVPFSVICIFKMFIFYF